VDSGYRFLYFIFRGRIYETIKENPERFGTSNYKLDNQFIKVQTNNREHGKMKDELAG